MSTLILCLHASFIVFSTCFPEHASRKRCREKKERKTFSTFGFFLLAGTSLSSLAALHPSNSDQLWPNLGATSHSSTNHFEMYDLMGEVMISAFSGLPFQNCFLVRLCAFLHLLGGCFHRQKKAACPALQPAMEAKNSWGPRTLSP